MMLMATMPWKGRTGMDYVDLGRRVRKQRKIRGWTQEMLAEKIGVSTSFIGHVERGTRKASLETLVALANTLEISVDYLLPASLEGEPLVPKDLNMRDNQRLAMQEIMATIQTHLMNWNKDDEASKP